MPCLFSIRRLDFTHAHDDELKHLSEACDPATFGVDQQDVYDETYRKAGKLDCSHFAMGFDPGHSGLMDLIRDSLLEGQDADVGIRYELYKLNVYGMSSQIVEPDLRYSPSHQTICRPWKLLQGTQGHASRQ